MRRGPDGLPVFLMAAVPLIGVEFGVEFLRFQSRRKRGVRSFHRMLLRSGVPPEPAARLAQAYHEAGSLRQILLHAVRSQVRRGRRSEPY